MSMNDPRHVGLVFTLSKPRYSGSRRSPLGAFLTRMCEKCGLVFFIVAGLAGTHLGAVQVAEIFDHNMVLQRDIPAPVWGRAEPGETVTVQLLADDASGKPAPMKSAATDADGRWLVRLDPMPADTRPRTLVIKGSNTAALVLTNVVVGDVWLCSGQSNMRLSVAQASNAAVERPAARWPDLRLFMVEKRAAEKPMTCAQKDWTPAKPELAWTACTPKSVYNFSAVAYYFARTIKSATNIPVGLIESAVSGSAAESWLSETAFQPLTNTPAVRIAFEKANGQRGLALFFNGMIAPLIPFGIKGAIWYQGEANVYRAFYYCDLMAALIQDWRMQWGQGAVAAGAGRDFPFLFVQLPNAYKPMPMPVESGWANLREAQWKLWRSLTNTGMIVAIDVGAESVHPLNKRDVGNRLGLLALDRVYGCPRLCMGPLFESAGVETNQIRIRFAYCGSGLAFKNGAPARGFAIASTNRVFVWAQARIEGQTVVVWSDQVPDPVAVRYAWANNPECPLFNKEGFPAAPFRTDDWPLPSRPELQYEKQL